MMSAQPETLTSFSNKKPHPAGQAYIAGRVHSVRKIDTKQGALWLTVMKLAAADSFSHPSTIELRSDARIGKPGDDWSGVVSISGMSNVYEKKDKETGEMETVHSARNELTVVEG